MKRRIVLCLFFVLIPLAGAAYARNWGDAVTRGNGMDRPASSSKVALGSTGYVRRIQEIAEKSGGRAALEQVMKDVDRFGAQLDGDNGKNRLRLYKYISSLVYRIGSVDMEINYFRNKLNRAPESLQEMIRLNASLPASKKWRLLTVGNSIYHLQGKDGIYNLKFLSPDGFCEAVYNKKGVLLNENNDPVNMGTFNYAAGMSMKGAHKKFDIDPYLKWGNSLNSPQKGAAQIWAGITKARKDYQAHAAEVNAYRSKILGLENTKTA